MLSFSSAVVGHEGRPTVVSFHNGRSTHPTQAMCSRLRESNLTRMAAKVDEAAEAGEMISLTATGIFPFACTN